MKAFLTLLLSLVAVSCRAQPARPLSNDQVQTIGRLIYLAETGGHPRELTFWDKLEDFPSLGIGHFIWYTSRRWRYEESFPPLVAYLEAHGVAMPDWTKGVCPWDNKAQFDADLDGPRLTELRRILLSTFALQTQYIMDRRNQALPAMLASLPAGQRDAVQRAFDSLGATPVGAYATIDYVNFKGEGTKPEERYNGQGWGLLQVLQGMRPRSGESANAAFARSCAQVLARRVANAPAGQQQQRERKFLPNWTERCREYGFSSLDQVLACKEHGRCP